MLLEPRQRELAAIGSSIGANCRPCIEHHISAGHEAGLSEAELDDAVTTAHAVRAEAVELLSARIAELLGHVGPPPEPAAIGQKSTDHELVALGASIGANAHALIHLHVGAALEAGLSPPQVRSALKMAEAVQQRASEMTADAATKALSETAGVPAGSPERT